MEDGFVKIYRSTFTHPAFSSLAEVGAWAFLISEASWKPETRRYKDRVIELERGQLTLSTRDFASEAGWSEPKVRRFLKKLENQRMIRRTCETGVNVITICNYEKYQGHDSDSGAGPTHQATQDRRTTDAPTPVTTLKTNEKTPPKKVKNIKKEEEKNTQKKNPDFSLFWDECPKKVGKLDAEKAFVKAVKTTSAEELAAAMKRHSAYWRRTETETQFIPNPATWLNRGSWMDELEGAVPAVDDSENPYTRMKRELLAQQENERSNVVKIG